MGTVYYFYGARLVGEVRWLLLQRNSYKLLGKKRERSRHRKQCRCRQRRGYIVA